MIEGSMVTISRCSNQMPNHAPIVDMPSSAIQFPWSDTEFDARAADAVREHWLASDGFASRQKELGRIDTGTRGEATGGQHLSAFTKLFREVAHAAGFAEAEVRFEVGIELHESFRARKKWDVVIVRGNRLCGAIDIKSEVGPSSGSNFNHRSGEALGSSADVWIAYREGVLGAQTPWLGYFLLVEEPPKSTASMKLPNALFEPKRVSDDTSYLDPYATLCRRLVLERKFSAAAFLTSRRESTGFYSEPDINTSIKAFTKGLFGHLVGMI